jgi:hypothetical protein
MLYGVDDLVLKPNSRSDIQEIPYILWKPNVHYRVNNSPPIFLVLSHMDPAHVLLPCTKLILILSYHLHLGHASGIYRSVLPTSTAIQTRKL